MIQFLKDRLFLQERVNNNVDVHPSDIELEVFHTIATTISPNQDFSYRGCQDCVNHMVKFSFDNADKITETAKGYELSKKGKNAATAQASEEV